jgi:hypothetical protein
MKKLQEKNKLDFAAINPADIIFLSHSNLVQISRRKAVALTTSPERFMKAVNEARQRAFEKEAAKKRYEADKAEQEALRAAIKAERDQKIVECPICPDGQKNVLMGYTRILFEKDRARRVCNRCFKARRESLAKQREKEARIAADKAAEEWLNNQMKSPVQVVQLPVQQPVSNNTGATFNAPKGLEAIEAMLAEVKVAEVTMADTTGEVTKPKAKRKPKAKNVSVDTAVVAPVAKKPRAKRAPEMAATA